MALPLCLWQAFSSIVSKKQTCHINEDVIFKIPKDFSHNLMVYNSKAVGLLFALGFFPIPPPPQKQISQIQLDTIPVGAEAVQMTK